MPRWKRRRLGTRVMSRSKRLTEPPSGRSSPVIRLKSVVLPAPLGPMMRRRSPGSTVRSTPDVTRSPPNDFVRLRTASALSVPPPQATPGRSDHVPISQLGDLRLLVTQLSQDLVGVLAHELGPPPEHRVSDREREDPAVLGAEQIGGRRGLAAIDRRHAIDLDGLLLDQGGVVEGDRGA